MATNTNAGAGGGREDAVKMESIAEMWQSFALTVIPPNAPSVQFHAMRSAFYAGAWSMLAAAAAAAASDGDEPASEKEVWDYLEGLHVELAAFLEFPEGESD